MRDHLVTMGVNKLGAGSKQKLGYSHDNESTAQFDITDSRDVDSIVEAIRGKGLEVFYKDWETLV